MPKKDIKEEAVEVKTIDSKPIKKKRRIFTREDLVNIQVKFINFCGGEFYYKDERSMSEYRLSSFGESDYITMDELKRMKSQHSAILTDFSIILTEVESDDTDLEDVLKYLGLEKLYTEILDDEEVDNLLLDNRQIGKLQDTFNKMPNQLKDRISDRAAQLYLEDELQSINVIDIIENYKEDSEFFRKLKIQKKYLEEN